jgi:ABC-2 type transport system permease protein
MNSVIASITLRQLLGRRRMVLLMVLGAVLVLVALVYRLSDPFEIEAAGWTAQLLNRFGVATLLALVALIVGTGAIGAEIDDGTVVHLLAKPISRTTIVLTKLSVAAALTGLLAGVPVLVAGLLAAGGLAQGMVVGFAIATAVGGLVYCALFLALSLVSRRALVIGLAYVLVWEGFLAGLFPGTRTFSVRQHILAWTDAFADLPPGVLEATVDPIAASVVGGLTLVGAVFVAIRRLGAFEIRGETA